MFEVPEISTYKGFNYILIAEKKTRRRIIKKSSFYSRPYSEGNPSRLIYF